MKKALITGITGQDGSYLAELLLAKGYEVHGIIRRASTFNTSRINNLYEDPHINGVRMFLHYGDLSDSTNLIKLLYRIQPDEVYHLAAQTHVRVSFDIPEYTGDVTGLGTVRLLEAIHEVGLPTRFYQAGSSEMYGLVQEVPQNETTPFYPRSPYGAAKVYAHWITVNYRESYGLFACNGILFNHESPRRGETFVTRKITRAAAHIQAGLQDKLYLGNLDAKRDWGYAKEYCGSHVADASAGRAGRLRDRHRRDAFGAGVSGGGLPPRGTGLERLCQTRCAFMNGLQKWTCWWVTPAKPKPSWAGSRRQPFTDWCG